jgi:hypothetical protein
MAKAAQVGGLRTMGSREAAEAGVGSDLSPQPVDAQYKFVYQSRKSDFVISLKRRRLMFDPNDQSKTEIIPETSAGTRLDMVRFKDHFFRTNDEEIDLAFQQQPSHVFGIEGLCWRASDLRKVQREARAAEIRAALAADPDLAKAVKLSPSEAKDWDVAKKPAAPVEKELSEEELERLTAPQK